MKVLLIHNEYQQFGGEDLVFENEHKLLENNNITTIIYKRSSCEIHSIFTKIRTFINITYSRKSAELIRSIINEEKPDIAHVHNFFPLISPSVYDACRKEGIPIIQTLHNYRIMCPSAILMRDGKICEKCIKRSPYNSVLHRCYRDSYVGTIALSRFVSQHRRKNTWNQKVSFFISLSDFSRSKFIEAGIDSKNIITKPNFIEDPKIKKQSGKKKRILFVGRLSIEKGIDFLISTWNSNNDLPELRIIGDGPLFTKYSNINNSNVTFLGKKERNEIYQEMSNASCLVFPSIWYEGFPMVILEAFAIGLPVVASNLGSMSSIIKNGYNGLHFEPSDGADLINKVSSIVNDNELEAELSKNARIDYEQFYTPEKNYEMLIDIYKRAINEYQ